MLFLPYFEIYMNGISVLFSTLFFFFFFSIFQVNVSLANYPFKIYYMYIFKVINVPVEFY